MREPITRLRGHVLAGLVNLTLCGLLVWGLRDPRDSAMRVEPAPTRTPAPSATPPRLSVHVAGAVRRPGLVSLTEGARAADAVAAAGGLLPEAAPAAVNLAAPLQDGQQLWVPLAAEAGGSSRPASALAPPAGGSTSPSAPAAALAESPPGGLAGPGQLDLNQASAAELEQLPGIGPALAARIVAHRETEGPFGSPRDLLEVSGIGEKTLARFEDRLRVR